MPIDIVILTCQLLLPTQLSLPWQFKYLVLKLEVGGHTLSANATRPMSLPAVGARMSGWVNHAGDP